MSLGFVVTCTWYNFYMLFYYEEHGTHKQWMDRVIHQIVYASLAIVICIVLMVGLLLSTKEQRPELFKRVILSRK